MENIGEEIIVMALPVALFLLNTNRVQKAIELCKESLFLMNCNLSNCVSWNSILFFSALTVVSLTT